MSKFQLSFFVTYEKPTNDPTNSSARLNVYFVFSDVLIAFVKHVKLTSKVNKGEQNLI